MFKARGAVWLRLGFVAAAAVLAISAATAQQGGAGRDLVLEGGTLIDGTGRTPIANAVVVVEGNRIKAVGASGQVPIPANANIIHLNARQTILPGLIDSHVHTKEWHYPMFLHYGVTTIFDFANDPGWILAQKEALAAGRIQGPRMFISLIQIWGPDLPETNGTFDTGPVHSVAEARAYTKFLAAEGADFIKVHEGITDDELKAIIEEGTKAGIPVAGHVRNIQRAASYGMQHEEHLDSMARALIDPDEKMKPTDYPPKGGPVKPPQVALESLIDPKKLPPLVDYMVKHGVEVNPTMITQWSDGTKARRELAAETTKLAHDPQMAFVPADTREDWARPVGTAQRAGYANVAEFLKEYSAAGGKVLTGTDASSRQNTIPGLALHYELRMLVDAGVPPMKAIQGATLFAAQFMRKDKDLGSVEPGKLADIIVIDGNPLADIRVTENVRTVIEDGKVIDTKYDPKWRNPIPEPYWPYPPMHLTVVSPKFARQGDSSVTLHLEGDHFAPNAIVRFDNVDLPTRFVNDKSLTATLDARLLQRPPGGYVVYVLNPGAGGTVSTTGYFAVIPKK